MIEDLQGAGGTFAVLTAFELLEDLHTPKAMIRKAFSLRQPRGYFLATTLSEEGWFLAISSGKGGLDGWRMMATDDTGTDLWTVAGAWEELERGGVAV